MLVNNIQFDKIEDLKERAFAYKYALVYMLSEVKLVLCSDLSELNWSEIIEARFFNKNGELHIFEYGDKIKAVEKLDETDDRNKSDVIVRKYDLSSKFSSLGSYIEVKQYIDYDEDGQAYVKLTRLSDVGRGE